MEELFIERDVDFKELYLKMVRATEEAIRVLVEVQKECENIYIETTALRTDEFQETRGDTEETE